MKEVVELLPRNLADTRVTVGEDGVWLHFKTTRGNAVSISGCVLRRALGSPVMREAFADWCNERVEQAKQMEALRLPLEPM